MAMTWKKRKYTKTASESLVLPCDERFVKLKQELLPGLPNDITLRLITTKLSWETLYVLSSTCRAWHQAHQDRLIYDARVCSHSTQSVVAINHIQDGKTKSIAIYSMKERIWHQLPLIPKYWNGFPQSCSCCSLDGRIYILGGSHDSCDKGGNMEVFVFDLAGHGRWKQCASMLAGRQDFGCGVSNGKIYVFGGTSFGKPLPGGESEVYDPQKDVWSPIRPMQNLRFGHTLSTFGNELYLTNGMFFGPPFKNEERPRQIYYAVGARAYNPTKNKWRTLSNFFRKFGKKLLVVGDRLFSITSVGMQECNIEMEETSLHCKYKVPFMVASDSIIGVDGEFLAIWGTCLRCLVHAKMLSDNVGDLVWELAPVSFNFGQFGDFHRNNFMVPLRL